MGISAALGSSALLPAGLGFRNVIINGNVAIDQRNAGASVTVNGTSNFYGPDRWQAFGQASDGTFTLQRISSSPTPPAGFTYALKVATGTADISIGATQTYGVIYKVEGLDAARFAWGTSGAKPAVLSFWVYGSKTGTYGGSFSNSAFDRSYPFTYTVNAINTWEYKTVYVNGDTTGTWLTDTGIGIRIEFSVGAGSTQLGTAGAWAGTRYDGATGQTNLIATSDSLVFTGVQLEQNYQPTPFEQRPYGVELQLCQRYYCKTFNHSVAPASAAGQAGALFQPRAYTAGTTTYLLTWRFPVEMRVAPTTVTTYSPSAAGSAWYDEAGGAVTAATGNAGTGGVGIYNSANSTAGRNAVIHATAEAEL